MKKLTFLVALILVLSGCGFEQQRQALIDAQNQKNLCPKRPIAEIDAKHREMLIKQQQADAELERVRWNNLTPEQQHEAVLEAIFLTMPPTAYYLPATQGK